MKFKRVGVIGAGTMGKGVAIDLILHGIKAVLVDVDQEILEQAKDDIIEKTRLAPLLQKSAPRLSKEEILNYLTLTTNIEDVEDCDFIIENVTEKWEIKKEVYQKLNQICDQDVPFGANTSCISITKIGSLLNRPDRVVGMHFMNPVFMKSVVEVIRGHHTTYDCIELVSEFLSQLDKKAIVVNDFPGFVANRLSHLFMNEAAWLIQDGVATAKQVDAIFKECYGHKMGPLETADLIGLDTVVDSLKVLYENYQDSKFRCCPLLKKMVDAGLLGKKSGEGFFKYNNR
ncbi:MAG: 3-hydroxyacyl-CoA dehydrogenase family protein [Halanaerobiales bacterium]|nr:3-hydroxyacyl-CoA dehydrogenase family protein [Halanaerobiales bacterium]